MRGRLICFNRNILFIAPPPAQATEQSKIHIHVELITHSIQRLLEAVMTWNYVRDSGMHV